MPQTKTPPRPEEFLPLTHLTFYLLLALAEEPAHGYALVQRIRERSGGLVDPGTGSFYSIIRGAVDSGLIREDQSLDVSGRRRFFALTPLGGAVLRAEHRRLEKLVADTKTVVRRKVERTR